MYVSPFLVKKTFILIFAFYAGSMVILNYLIPPFQNPDEPVHFGTILIYLKGEEKKDEMETQIIQMMDRHFWWRYVGLGRPEVLPTKLSAIPFLMQNYPLEDFRLRLNNLVLYHRLMALGFKVAGLKNLSVNRLYFIYRLTSAFFLFLSLFLIGLTIKRINPLIWSGFNKQPSEKLILISSVLILLFAIFLPQFLMAGVAVSPDAFIIFMGCLFFLLAFEVIIKGKFLFYWPLLGFLVLVGILADRALFPFILIFLLSLVFSLNKENYKVALPASIFLFFGFILISYLLVFIFPAQIESSLNLLKNVRAGLKGIWPKFFSLSDYNRQFLLFLLDSFWLRFGWMAFTARKVFYLIWRLLIFLASVGVIVYFIKIFLRTLPGKERERQKSLMIERVVIVKIILFSILCLFIQLFGIYSYYGRVSWMPQGRYIFPLITPLLLLFFVGIVALLNLWRFRAGLVAMALIVIFVFLFSNIILWGKVASVFHLTVRGPHPGL